MIIQDKFKDASRLLKDYLTVASTPHQDNIKTSSSLIKSASILTKVHLQIAKIPLKESFKTMLNVKIILRLILEYFKTTWRLFKITLRLLKDNVNTIQNYLNTPFRTSWAALESNSKSSWSSWKWGVTVLGKVTTILGMVVDHFTVGGCPSWRWCVTIPLNGRWPSGDGS